MVQFDRYLIAKKLEKNDFWHRLPISHIHTKIHRQTNLYFFTVRINRFDDRYLQKCINQCHHKYNDKLQTCRLQTVISKVYYRIKAARASAKINAVTCLLTISPVLLASKNAISCTITAANSWHRSLAAIRSPNEDNSVIYPHVNKPYSKPTCNCNNIQNDQFIVCLLS